MGEDELSSDNGRGQDFSSSGVDNDCLPADRSIVGWIRDNVRQKNFVLTDSGAVWTREKKSKSQKVFQFETASSAGPKRERSSPHTGSKFKSLRQLQAQSRGKLLGCTQAVLIYNLELERMRMRHPANLTSLSLTDMIVEEREFIERWIDGSCKVPIALDDLPKVRIKLKHDIVTTLPHIFIL